MWLVLFPLNGLYHLLLLHDNWNEQRAEQSQNAHWGRKPLLHLLAMVRFIELLDHALCTSKMKWWKMTEGLLSKASFWGTDSGKVFRHILCKSFGYTVFMTQLNAEFLTQTLIHSEICRRRISLPAMKQLRSARSTYQNYV